METQDRYTAAIEWFLDHLRAERGASPHTIAAYARDLDVASAFFRERSVPGWDCLTPHDLASYVSAHPGCSPATVRRRASSLRSLLKFLKRAGEGPSGELPSAGGIRLAKRVPKALKPEELARLLGSPDLSKPEGIRDRALMEVVYGTGLRVSEAVGLRVEEVLMEQAAFRVVGKRAKTRWVPIPRHTVPWIEQYLSVARPKLVRGGVPQVFVGDRGAALSRQSAYMVFDRHRRLAGIKQAVSPHTLRHTYAVHLIQGGADLRSVQELLGHASISTTQIYTQLDLEQVKSVYQAAHPRH